MKYAIAEVFPTLQGEGKLAGTPAVFLRMAGCNMWSGREETRDRDAERNGAKCPRWCDTDFLPRHLWSVGQILAALKRVRTPGTQYVVVTGGEPLLQLDAELAEALSDKFFVAIETNGTVPLDLDIGSFVSWLCCSPKLPPDQLKLTRGHELKVVVPAYDPLAYLEYAGGFSHRYVQPQARGNERDEEATQCAIQFCLTNPGWKLSVQTHKMLGLR